MNKYGNINDNSVDIYDIRMPWTITMNIHAQHKEMVWLSMVESHKCDNSWISNNVRQQSVVMNFPMKRHRSLVATRVLQ